MNISNELKKLKGDKTFILVIFDLIMLAAPGAMSILIFDQNLFQSLDWARLLILGVAIMAPFIFINTLIVLSILKKDLGPDNPDALFLAFSFGTYVSGIIVYALIGMHYFFGKGLMEIAAVTCITEIAIVIVLAFRDWRQEVRARKNSVESTK